MCARYFYHKNTLKLAKEAAMLKTADEKEDYDQEICPGKDAFIFAKENEAEEEKKILIANWGFPGKDKSLIINARCETAAEKTLFRSSMENRRCIVPAAGFFEWDRMKNKVRFTLPDSQVLFLAGFWNLIDDRLRFVILTTDANESMAPVHDRMPVIIAEENISDWIFDDRNYPLLLKEKMPQLTLKRDEEQLMLF